MTPPRAHPAHGAEARGLALGLLGVTIFALTLPMTRLAVGTPDAPLMSGLFIAMGRAALAGLLSGALLLALRAPLPQRADAWPLVLTALGVVFGSRAPCRPAPGPGTRQKSPATSRTPKHRQSRSRRQWARTRQATTARPAAP